jgi:hypothetical protein
MERGADYRVALPSLGREQLAGRRLDQVALLGSLLRPILGALLP